MVVFLAERCRSVHVDEAKPSHIGDAMNRKVATVARDAAFHNFAGSPRPPTSLVLTICTPQVVQGIGRAVSCHLPTSVRQRSLVPSFAAST